MTTSDDDSPKKLESEKEAPSEAAALSTLLIKGNARFARDVETTRGRGIKSLIGFALSSTAGFILALLTNFDWSHPDVAKILISIGALATVTLGSSIGFFLSIPDKRRRRRNLNNVLSPTTYIFHGNVSASSSVFGTNESETSGSGDNGAGNSGE